MFYFVSPVLFNYFHMFFVFNGSYIFVYFQWFTHRFCSLFVICFYHLFITVFFNNILFHFHFSSVYKPLLAVLMTTLGNLPGSLIIVIWLCFPFFYGSSVLTEENIQLVGLFPRGIWRRDKLYQSLFKNLFVSYS